MLRRMILLTIFAVIICISAAGVQAAEVCFVQISDLHILDRASADYLSKAIERINDPNGINGQKPSFVIVTGDLSTDSRPEQIRLCKSVLDKLKIPYFPVPGNHDIHTDEYGKLFPGKSRYSIKQGDYRLLFDIGEVGKRAEGSPVPLEEWVSSEVGKTPKDQRLVFVTHYPYGLGVPYCVEGREKVLSALKTRKLLAVLSGHFHADTTVVEDGVLFKTIPCLTSTRNNHAGEPHKGMILYVLNDDCISATFVKISDR